ncbi:hypothetical protein BGZ80_004271, partial [Entomortierella chlamydospora]
SPLLKFELPKFDVAFILGVPPVKDRVLLLLLLQRELFLLYLSLLYKVPEKQLAEVLVDALEDDCESVAFCVAAATTAATAAANVGLDKPGGTDANGQGVADLDASEYEDLMEDIRPHPDLVEPPIALAMKNHDEHCLYL